MLSAALPVAVWETITPAIAQMWLRDYNDQNRAIRRDYLTRLVRDMQEGRWDGHNGEAIRFDVSGRLVDGQHRLMACMVSGVTIVSLVVRGIPADSYKTVGIGAPKGFADFLSPYGEKNANNLAALTRLVFLWMNDSLDQSKNGRRLPTVAELAVTLEQNPDMRESVRFVVAHADIKRTFTPSVACLVHYAGTLSGNNALVCDFLERTGNGLGLFDDNPIFHLRKFLLGQRSNRRKHAFEYNLALCIKAWNYVLDGRKTGGLRFTPEEQFPILR